MGNYYIDVIVHGFEVRCEAGISSMIRMTIVNMHDAVVLIEHENPVYLTKFPRRFSTIHENRVARLQTGMYIVSLIDGEYRGPGRI